MKPFPSSRPSPSPTAGFSLIELLVATAILMLLLGVVLSLTGTIGSLWNRNAGQAAVYRNARVAFATLTRTLSQATLHSYLDAVDANGSPRTTANAATLIPTALAQASELHFISGPASALLPGGHSATTPGHAIFFQAPLGETAASALKPLRQSLNSVGFHIQYGPVENTLLPTWLQAAFSSSNRFRLVQSVDPADTMSIYASTADGSYDLDWLDRFSTPSLPTHPRPRVLAEDVCLLVFRVRMSPEEETAFATRHGLMPNGDGTLIAPNYHYDSRAWENGYPSGERVTAAGSAAPRIAAMRNQLPAILDIAMVSLEPASLQRLDFTGSTPPALFQPATGAFSDATAFDADLAAYSQQLHAAGINHRVLKTTLHLPGSGRAAMP